MAGDLRRPPCGQRLHGDGRVWRQTTGHLRDRLGAPRPRKDFAQPHEHACRAPRAMARERPDQFRLRNSWLLLGKAFPRRRRHRRPTRDADPRSGRRHRRLRWMAQRIWANGRHRPWRRHREHLRPPVPLRRQASANRPGRSGDRTDRYDRECFRAASALRDPRRRQTREPASEHRWTDAAGPPRCDGKDQRRAKHRLHRLGWSPRRIVSDCQRAGQGPTTRNSYRPIT